MSAENGFVPTPEPVGDLAAASTFAVDRPDKDQRLLLPGLGTGNLYDAARRYCTPGEGLSTCRSFDHPMPECVGVENDPKRVDEFESTHSSGDIEIQETDFLLDPPEGPFDWVLANPPYIRYQQIDTEKREKYRKRFRTTNGKFDLFVPFFEQSMRLLKPNGWLTFILPVTALVTPMFEQLRWEFRSRFVEPIWYLPPETFDEKVETVMISVQNKRSEYPNGNLWLESLYSHELRRLLKGLEVDDVDAAVDRYYEEHQITERIVKRRDARERREAKNNGRQSNLEQFYGSGTA